MAKRDPDKLPDSLHEQRAKKFNRGHACESIAHLERLLNDRIGDLHGIKGHEGERHALVLYRNLASDAKLYFQYNGGLTSEEGNSL